MLRKNWYRILIGLFLVAVVAFYMVIGENSYIAVHDNMDLFIPQFQMLKDTHTFWSQHVCVPFLHGISRDALPSELSLDTILYWLFPSFTAYIIGYLMKILIAMLSCGLLARDVLQHEGLESYGRRNQAGTLSDLAAYDTRALTCLCGFAYGILNLFPAFGIPFASIPFIVYVLRNVYRNPSLKWYLAVFCYPFLSYFSYFGLFILGYLTVAAIWLWIRDRRLSLQLFFSQILLGLGCMVFEYRLFHMMLFDGTVSIRTTMIESNLSAAQIIREICDVWSRGMMHADDAHLYLVLPVCVCYFLYLNIKYIIGKNIKGIFCDYYNLCALIILFNSVVYGIYDSEAVRNVISAIVPPLKGWQFNRTIFFNPFLWYCSLYIICYRLMIEIRRRWPDLAANSSTLLQNRLGRWRTLCVYLLPITAIAVILLQPARYNDLYHTAYGTAYRIMHDGKGPDTMNWREFYSVKLFDQIKADLNYQKGDWSVAYGMYPAVLEYNGISTLDGYLGFYSQEYKEQFRQVIAPALERVPASQIYYDDWGARCYLYSGTDVAIQLYTKSLSGLTDDAIYIDAAALKKLGCKYIFSRIEISNAEHAGVTYVKAYSDKSLPYTVYVYTIR